MVLLELRLYSVVDSVINEFGAVDEMTVGREADVCEEHPFPCPWIQHESHITAQNAAVGSRLLTA
jgi:hypothetical protein